jgi:hypothetical protein
MLKNSQQWNYIVPMLLSIRVCCGHDRFEQYFKHRTPVLESQSNRINNCTYVSNSGSTYVYRNIVVVIKLKNYAGEYENNFRRQ